LQVGGNVYPQGCGAGGTVQVIRRSARCVAAYDTFMSMNITPNASTLLGQGTGCSPSCTFTAGGKSVHVDSPYTVPGHNGNALLHVSVCWSNPTQFARVVGVNKVDVCGEATAKNLGVAPTDPGSPPDPTVDCAGEDNFIDNPDEAIGKPTN